MCLDTFFKVSKGNNLISKSNAFHNVGAAYTKDLSKNELAHVLLIVLYNTYNVILQLHIPELINNFMIE